MAGKMTLKEMRRECALWQDKLGLQQWKIELRHPHKGEMPEEWAACVSWSAEYASARILIHRKHMTLHAMVHELLHVCLEGYNERPRTYTPQYELALNKLTEALLDEPEPDLGA